MPWVPPMPGNKTYVLQEAQKEIERLREEIERLSLENQELRTGMHGIKEREETEGKQKTLEASSDLDAASPGVGEYFVVTGVIKILAHL